MINAGSVIRSAQKGVANNSVQVHSGSVTSTISIPITPVADPSKCLLSQTLDVLVTGSSSSGALRGYTVVLQEDSIDVEVDTYFAGSGYITATVTGNWRLIEFY